MLNLKHKTMKKIPLTHAMNGYPDERGDFGIIGFDTFDEAEEFADQFNLDVGVFETRDGWHFWKHLGCINEPFSPQDLVDKLGDNAQIVELGEDETLINDNGNILTVPNEIMELRFDVWKRTIGVYVPEMEEDNDDDDE